MKNLEFQELTMQELQEVDGGGWFSDALDWIGETASKVWEWMKKHGKRDGNPGIII